MLKVKRWLSLTLALAFACLLLPAREARAEAYAFGVTYKSSTVNLRAQPTQYSTRLGSYAKDSWMAISGESGNWYYVTAPDGKTGYMSKNYVSVAQENYATIGVVTNPKATSFLNLRETPSYSAKVKGIYYNGVPCILLNYSGGWYNVRVNGQEGYFREEFITRHHYPYAEEVATIVTPGNTGLNLRKGPGMGYAAIGQYKGGKYVMVLQKGTDWWKVSIGGQVGFMNTDFLKEGIIAPGSSASASTSSGTSSSSEGYALVTNPRTTQVLNLRERPATTSRVLGQYRNGTRVTVLRQGTKWCKVMNAQGIVGYMMSDYLTIYNMASTPTMKVSHPQKTYVNLRSAPSMTGGSVLAQMPHGATVTVVTPGDSWVQVKYNGITGYAVAYFLQ